MKKFISKKKLKQKLEEQKHETMKYKSIISMIEYKLREQKETNSNVFTLLRDLNEIIYIREEEDKNV